LFDISVYLYATDVGVTKMALPSKHAPPIMHRKPNLSRLMKRQIMFPAVGGMSRSALEAQLTRWMADVLNVTRHPYKITAKYLVNTSDGMDSLLEDAPSMHLGGGSVAHTFHAHFDLGALPQGDWFVRHVTFMTQEDFEKYQSEQGPTEWNPELYDDDKTRQQKKIKKEFDDKYANSAKARAFKWQLHLDDPFGDISTGNGYIDTVINMGHDLAQQAAALPENFYTRGDMAKDVLMMGAGKLVDAGVKAEKAREGFKKAYDAADHVADGVSSTKEERDKIRESEDAGESKDILTQSQYGVSHKTRADAWGEQAVDIVSWVPVGGQFVKMFAGMFMEVGIANYAGKVTRIRIRAYTWYATGCILGLTGVDNEHPTEKFDKLFYDSAFSWAAGLDETQRYQAQLYLLAYDAGHYLLGTRTPGEKKEYYHPEDCTFPRDLAGRWSPRTMGSALATRFRTYDLLVN